MTNEQKLAHRLEILARLVEGTAFVAWARELREASAIVKASGQAR